MVDSGRLAKRSNNMPRTHPGYPDEFRQQILERVQAGRSPDELAQEFEPTAQTIRNWIKQAERDQDQRHDGLSHDEKVELTQLRKENKHCGWSERSCQKPQPGSHERPTLFHRSLPIRECAPGFLSGEDDVSCVGRAITPGVSGRCLNERRPIRT
jgi:transposase